MQGIWGKSLSEEKNVTLAFSLDLGTKKRGRLKIAAASCYKLYVDGKIVGFGPQRAAHGYVRVAEYGFSGRFIIVEVESCYVPTFCWVKRKPFFACEVIPAGGERYSAADFACYRLTDRVQKVQRYSFQRGFAEVYRTSEDRSSLYRGKSRFDRVECEGTIVPPLLASYVPNAKLTRHSPANIVERGGVAIDETAKPWRDRAHNLQYGIEGFSIEEWEESATDEASRFVFHPDGKAENCGLVYETFDFGRAITGFSELEIKAKQSGMVYVLFDELLWEEKGKGKNYVGFERNTCSSVHKWTLERGGAFSVSSFEPYTVRYACVVHTPGMEIEIYQRDYENPSADKFGFSCPDREVAAIVEAARATLAQNSVDILMDCPSRERAGWLSDSWFSSVAERLFTGDNAAERTFLENYILADKTGLPEGMLPMCYPADDYDGCYIPNWAMWYVLEVVKYAQQYGAGDLVVCSKENICGIFSHFAEKENELGLLENLEGWVFVEWSAANAPDHIKGVNVPSNICYAAALEQAGNLYQEDVWVNKAVYIRAKIREIAFDGRFFVDNLTRDENANLVQTGLLTEVCQYYAFWFGCITTEEYPALFEELTERLGLNRAEGYLPKMEKPNAMYGIYMRLDLLMRAEKREQVLEECLCVFGKMAGRTGTLWENNNIGASCNHGFASYAARWIVWALTGYDVMKGGSAAKDGIGIDCVVSLPTDGGRLCITVKDNRVRMRRIAKRPNGEKRRQFYCSEL